MTDMENKFEVKLENKSYRNNQQSSRFSPPCTLYLVSGYKKTGKDTWYESLNRGVMPAYSTVLYDHNGARKEFDECLNLARLELGTVARVKFADALVKQTIRQLQLDQLGYGSVNMDQVKDTMHVGDRSIREHMKIIAKKEKENDQNVYARATCDAIERLMQQGTRTIVVTDWRFEHELEYVRYCFGNMSNVSIHTVRVWRYNVVIPPMSDETEHELDRYPFDMHFMNIEPCTIKITKQSTTQAKTMTTAMITSIHLFSTLVDWLSPSSLRR
jgi:hypothetical protein